MLLERLPNSGDVTCSKEIEGLMREDAEFLFMGAEGDQVSTLQ